MGSILVYRNRTIKQEDIEFIRQLIVRHPEDGRSALSRRICHAWNWVQPNGQLKDMICRGLLLQLERGGYIMLPERRHPSPNPLLRRKPPAFVKVDDTPIEASVRELFPITFCQVRRTSYERLFNSLIEQYHYLGYTQPVGEHLKYLVFAQGRPIAAFAWSSPAWHLGPRDRFIGWSPEVRKRNLHYIAYNTRFLVLPWVRVKSLGSHLLSRCARIISSDWEKVYNHPLYFLETFVDTGRFAGTCYKAAGWLYLGQTTGRGKNAQSHKPTRSVKAVFGYPLSRAFRKRLCDG